jgi:hypothetical protein
VLRRGQPPASRPVREHLPVVAQVAREEDDEEHLRELARLEDEGADVHPERRAVDRPPDEGQGRQDEEDDRRDAQQVLEVVEDAVVAEEEDERDEDADADDDPEALPEGEARLDPVDLGEAERAQEPGERQEVRVGVRQADAQGEVRRDEEGEEEARVGERGRRDDVLARDVDRGEPRDREEADEDEVEKLPRAEGQGIASAS